jgi:hypothetical protein
MTLLSLLLFVWFIPTFAPGEGGPGQIAPSFFPRIAVAVVFVCALLIMAANARALAAPGAGEGGRLLAEIAGWTVFASPLFALLAFAGFVPAGMFGVLAGVALTRCRRQPLLILLLAVGLPLFLDWAVWTVFLIDLP